MNHYGSKTLMEGIYEHRRVIDSCAREARGRSLRREREIMRDGAWKMVERGQMTFAEYCKLCERNKIIIF